jgi:endonuclease III
MKQVTLYTRRIKQLFSKLKKAGEKAHFVEVGEPMRCLLLSILSNYASESRAASAVSRIESAVVDSNELRVTPIAEIVEMIGADYPNCRAAGEEVSRVLQAIFNRLHHLDIEFLRSGSKKSAETFLNSLDGMEPHTRAMMVARCVNSHAIPLDVHMHAFLCKSDYLPEDTTVDDAQRFVANRIKDRDGMTFYSLLKRFAATHAPRKIGERASRGASKAAGRGRKTSKSKSKAAAKKKAKAVGTAKPKKTTSREKKKAATKKTAARKTTRRKTSAARKKSRSSKRKGTRSAKRS